jgi:hypothetical protein
MICIHCASTGERLCSTNRRGGNAQPWLRRTGSEQETARWPLRSPSGYRCACIRHGDHERLGIVVEDFGDSAGQGVDVGEHHIVDAARRWAVELGDGSLVFVDSGDLALG